MAQLIKVASMWKPKDDNSNAAASGPLEETAAAMMGLPKGVRFVQLWRKKQNDNEPDFDLMMVADGDQSRDQSRDQGNGQKRDSRW